MRGVIVMVVVLSACGRFGFDGTAIDASEPVDEAVGADVTIDAPGYRASAVRFESAGNDHIWTGFLANTSNSPSGTYSLWIDLTGGDGELQMLSVAQVLGIGGVLRTIDNRFRFVIQNCLAIVLLDMETATTYTSASSWVHLLASWDVSAGRAQIYINDVSDRAASATTLPGNLCYASLRWGIGGLSLGQLDADVADLYANLGTYLDLDVEANRRLFIDAAGKPVDLGPGCTTPTGSAPTGCFVGEVATWSSNKGIGQGFNVDGDGLVEAPTSPSDD